MSGGVRNLRAMFENKDPAESEDRGRSPGSGSLGQELLPSAVDSELNLQGVPSTGASPRPLSKVRTSFVTVERSGQLGNQIGLMRADSAASNTSRRRTSIGAEDETVNDMQARKQSVALEQALKKHSAMEEQTQEVVEEKAPPAEKTIPVSNGVEKTEPAKPATPPPAPSKVEEKVSTGKTNGAAKAPTTKPAEKSAATKTATKPVAISTAKPTASSKTDTPRALKSPLFPKTPTTPNRGQTKATEAPAQPKETKPKEAQVKEAPVKPKETAPKETTTKATTKRKDTKAPRASLAPKPTATRSSSRPPSTHTNGAAPKTRIPKESPPQTGFKKPRPKSPTRPVKLPASLTAHTASSGSKTAASPPRRSLSRASGSSHTNSLQAPAAARSPARSPSRVSTTSSVGRKPSTTRQGGTRPSIGPPPAQAIKKKTSRASLAQQPAPADESFLARMMRPTTASQGKTAEKPAENAVVPKRAPSVKRQITGEAPAKTHDSSKVSPKQKAKQVAPAKVATKTTKPVEKAPKTPTSVIKSSTKTVPKKESKEKVVDVPAPVPEEVIEAPVIQAAPVEEATEIAPVAEIKVEEVAQASPEVAKDEPVVEEKVVTPVAEVKEEAVVPEPVKEQGPVEEPIAVPEPVVEAVVESQEETPVIEAPKVQEPEIVETKQEVPAVIEPEISVQVPVKETVVEPANIAIPPTPIQSRFQIDEDEDPEDAKARAEIEKLNAEFAKLAAAP
ncbi:hypothetical protein HYALB_00007961 [Hymenoscyphus albidus]|uniref:Mucin-7 protein n=1 Tax=Hymenoscyphus albidus TaxID=595503 RepID=A0A9N9LGZ7_9HELO|nr:hypothetical protein HYALB_00007961 [Hymenoscyphus albidus]